VGADLVRARPKFYDEKVEPFEDADVCFELLRENDFAFVHQILSYSRRDNESFLASMRSYHYELLFRLVTLLRWGPVYLSKQEMHSFSRNAQDQYAKAMADGALHMREREFWEFQQKMADRFGFRINRWLLLKSYVGRVLDRLGNPKRTLESLRTRLPGARESKAKMRGLK
jgi:hypothetical protein